MLYRPRKGMHYSRYAMGFVFLGCGLLLATEHVPAGGMFVALAAVVLYYAPRWNLSIEISRDALRFSENVVDTVPVELGLSEILEIRRVSEREERKGLLATYPEYRAFVEIETRDGRVFRMHDIFAADFDEGVMRLGAAWDIKIGDFPRE